MPIAGVMWLQISTWLVLWFGFLFALSYFGTRGLDARYGQTGDNPRELSWMERGSYDKAKGLWHISRVLFPAALCLWLLGLIIEGIRSLTG